VITLTRGLNSTVTLARVLFICCGANVRMSYTAMNTIRRVTREISRFSLNRRNTRTRKSINNCRRSIILVVGISGRRVVHAHVRTRSEVQRTRAHNVRVTTVVVSDVRDVRFWVDKPLKQSRV